MTGEMKGGMRKAKSLYLKGSMPSDVRDERFLSEELRIKS